MAVLSDWFFPSSTGTPSNDWGLYSDATKAYAEDSIGVTCQNGGTQSYSGFNINIPTGAIILGIEVSTRGAGSISPTPNFGVEVSWNGGTTFSTTGTIHNHAGGWSYSSGAYPNQSNSGTYLWGRSWTTSELSNSNFVVNLIYHVDNYSVDVLRVRINYIIAGSISGDALIGGSVVRALSATRDIDGQLNLSGTQLRKLIAYREIGD